jgi:hypothetical protein
MAQEESAVVTPVSFGASPRRSRTFEERLMVRFPSLYGRFAALVLNLSPHSRLRRAFLRWAFVSAWAAFNRRDFKLMLVRYAPDVEMESDPGLQTLGFAGSGRGHVALVEGTGEAAEVWGDTMEYEPVYVIDLGDSVLCLGFFRAKAHASGVPIQQEAAQWLSARDGLVSHERLLFSWEEGLRAAGLNPKAITLPSREKTAQAAGLQG